MDRCGHQKDDKEDRKEKQDSRRNPSVGFAGATSPTRPSSSPSDYEATSNSVLVSLGSQSNFKGTKALTSLHRHMRIICPGVIQCYIYVYIFQDPLREFWFSGSWP